MWNGPRGRREGSPSTLSAVRRLVNLIESTEVIDASYRVPAGRADVRARPVTAGASALAGDAHHVAQAELAVAILVEHVQYAADPARAGQLLAILAPIVMSFLAQRFAQQGNASNLSQALGQEAPQAASAGGISGVLNMFDQDGDGQFGLSDVMGILSKR